MIQTYLLYIAKYTVKKIPVHQLQPARSGAASETKSVLLQGPRRSACWPSSLPVRSSGDIWAGLATNMTKSKRLLSTYVSDGHVVWSATHTGEYLQIQNSMPCGASMTLTPCPSKCLTGSASTSTSRRF